MANHPGMNLQSLFAIIRVMAEHLRQHDRVGLVPFSEHPSPDLRCLRREATVPQQASEHDVPRDGVPLRHCVKHLARHLQVAALGVHLHEGVAHGDVGSEAGAHGVAVHGPTELGGPGACAGPERALEGEPVARGALLVHLEVEGKRIVVAADVCVAGDEAVPRERAVPAGARGE
uniref:Uncharacterized protein n=1 Tax=Triticum urartu TaxID=4572 RepID=A0A8R7VBS4_TRIUA